MHESMKRLYESAAQYDPDIITQSDLARALNTTPQRIKNWEDRGVAKDALLDIEQTFRVSPSGVMNGVVVSNLPQKSAAKTGMVRFDKFNARPSAGHGSFLDVSPGIIDSIEVLESWAFEKLGTNNPNKIKIVTNKGVSMAPTIRDGDLLFVDVTQDFFDGDGIYVISWNGMLLTKRLIAKLDGRISISSDNQSPEYQTEYINHANHESLSICGKVKAYFSLREII